MAAQGQTPTYFPMGPLCSNYEPFSGITSFPGYQGLHCHDFYEFYVFFAGAPYYSINGQVVPLASFTLVIIPPFYMHGLIGTESDAAYERAWLYVTPAMLQKLGMGTQALSSYFRECANTGRAFFTIRQQEAEKLRTLIEEIRLHISEQSDLGQWQNHLRVARFLSLVYDLTQSSDAACRSVVPNKAIHPILGYIDEHFREPISIPELSRKFGISSSYMTREFAAYTGRSVYDYVLYRRILSAKEMICGGGSFTQIAFDCGFNDYSCFLRAFQKLTGQSPSAYRKYIQSIGELPDSGPLPDARGKTAP